MNAIARHPKTRSGITNGSKLLEGVSACSAAGRRYADLIADLTQACGGTLTLPELLRVRAVATLVCHGENLAAAMLKGEPVSSEELTRVSNSADRMLRALKSSAPKPKSAGRAGLRDYLASKGQPA